VRQADEEIGAGDADIRRGDSQVILSIRDKRRIFFTLVIFAACLFSAATGRATVVYSVSVEHPEQHLFHVEMSIPDVAGEVVVQMPAWNALYQIRDFSGHLERVEAMAGAAPAAFEKLDKQTWRIIGNGTITMRYAAYWDEAGPFAAQLNSEHAFINAAMILMYVRDRRSEDVRMCLRDLPAEWRTTMDSDESSGAVRQTCSVAADYDALADAPVETGKFEQFLLPGIAPEIRVVVHGDNWKRKRVEEELTRICRYEIKLMDGAPFQRYTFLLHIGKGAAGSGGGMEHANSTAISAPSDEFLSGVAAHEFFHLWNVKRIRPASLEPVDYTKEQYTRALWFAEGVTSTYGSYTLERAGLWSKQQFYEDLSQQITELEGRPAEGWQSAEQSSLDAWLEKYRLYNRAEESVSYYTKGQVLGVLLDILIRERSGNQKSLDDVLRAMNEEFAKTGKTYRDSLDVRLTAEKVAGGSFDDFFARYVAGAEALPYAKVFALAGLELRSAEHKRAVPGFLAERDASGAVTVGGLDASGNAAVAGLRAGDVIESWNGGETPRRLERWTSQQKAGSMLRLRIRRDEKELSLEFRLGEIRDIRYEIVEMSHASDEARRIREGWLRGTTSGAAAP
jgi:predicted metalloprotease with PDZ domain